MERARRSNRVAKINGKRKQYDDKKKNRNGLLIDLNRWEMSSLKRYRAHFKLDTRPNIPKGELIDVVARHFSVLPKMRDAEVISQFLFHTRKYLDGTSDSNEQD
mmetsp:Transcript_2700/g.4973  ORF Transcript_2700/g.4973 Transcript_2700/m.4973 type:complete len:104 (-) Transcript_2700:109-420(-)|eukprot:CAMPEP_0197524358 /NCGR_PEP_ID=MMETSP1318-20131121/9060_1 /TAXON_ID=552666 /ORGANISM="Partenskyella glossopodia, Strain RCC365" /LENGTH=103 /DNA_ID=CAMNT_0043077299 /DNA_START=101 /DNA_END=412 /DNA_ORIENTATION=-